MPGPLADCSARQPGGGRFQVQSICEPVKPESGWVGPRLLCAGSKLFEPASPSVKSNAVSCRDLRNSATFVIRSHSVA